LKNDFQHSLPSSSQQKLLGSQPAHHSKTIMNQEVKKLIFPYVFEQNAFSSLVLFGYLPAFFLKASGKETSLFVFGKGA
jgi:hypothetical protein